MIKTKWPFNHKCIVHVFVIGDVPRKYEGKKPNFMSIYMIFFKILIDIIVYYWKLHLKILENTYVEVHCCKILSLVRTFDHWSVSDLYSCTSAVRRPSTSKGNIGFIDWLIYYWFTPYRQYCSHITAEGNIGPVLHILIKWSALLYSYIK